MKTRFRRRIELRTDIAARDRVDVVLHDPPFDQRLDIDFVEGLETLFREWRGRAQLAGAERRQRPARRLDDLRNLLKALAPREHARETHPLGCGAVERVAA